MTPRQYPGFVDGIYCSAVDLMQPALALWSRKVASKGGMKVKERNTTNVKRYLPIAAT